MPKNKFKRIHTNKKLYFLLINVHMNFIFRNEWLKFDCWNKKIQHTSVQVLNLSFSTKALLGLLSLTLQRKGPLYEKVACRSKNFRRKTIELSKRMILEIKRRNAIKNIRWGIFSFELNGKCFFINRTEMLKNTIFPITNNCLSQIKPNYETLQCTKLFLKIGTLLLPYIFT